jgi:hypothetical protein
MATVLRELEDKEKENKPSESWQIARRITASVSREKKELLVFASPGRPIPGFPDYLFPGIYVSRKCIFRTTDLKIVGRDMIKAPQSLNHI